MTALEIIARKRDGHALSRDQIAWFVHGIVAGRIPVYQAAAWLMAVYLRGMDARETLQLTLAMRDSGQTVDLSNLKLGTTLDKHSTGGVGDKTTLVVTPLLASCGVPMLKMSGRSLGFSGGTIDKLESIPGFRTDLSIDRAVEQVRTVGAALIAQSSELVPADKILYGLRDVTATVDCLPLIASSIMSKKLAGGADRIVLDVKVGCGAFMKTVEQARVLANQMVGIGESAGRPTSAVLTRMDEPLGRAVGNALEVREAIAVLRNDHGVEPQFRHLCLVLAAHGLIAVGKADSEEEGIAIAEEHLVAGDAGRKFAEIVAAQGGPESLEAIEAGLPRAERTEFVASVAGGWVGGLDAEAIGRLSMALGAGRNAKSDTVDARAGIDLRRKLGDAVAPGETLGVMHYDEGNDGEVEAYRTAFRAAFQITAQPGTYTPASLVLEVV